MRPRGTSHDLAEAVAELAPGTEADIERVASAYLTALEGDMAAPSVADVNAHLRAVESTCAALLRRLTLIGEVLGRDTTAGFTADLQALERAVGMAALQGRGSIYRRAQPSPKAQLAEQCLALWLRYRRDPPKSTPGGPFHRFCCAVYNHATREDGNGPGVGMEAYVKGAVNSWKRTAK